MNPAPRHMTLDELFASPCGDPQCTHPHDETPLYMRALCHPHGGLNVMAHPRRRVIAITCAACGRHVTTLHAPPAAAAGDGASS